jgi:hypothetical protein
VGQCAIPAFDGLLPEPHNQWVLQLLFVAAHWHGLAKLRLHHDLTLDLMDAVTVSLGEKLREFKQNTCSAFVTHELQQEFSARIRRGAKNFSANKYLPDSAAGQPTPALHIPQSDSNLDRDNPSCNNSIMASTPSLHPPEDSGTQPLPASSIHQSDSVNIDRNNPLLSAKDSTAVSVLSNSNTRCLKTFNLNTYKVHTLGDYTTTIKRYGTTDSYSTKLVCRSFDQMLSGTSNGSIG